MAIRVTHRSIQTSSLANLQANLTKMAKLQEQFSSGRLINRPSDDPAGTVTALQVRADNRTNDQYLRNIDSGIGWLATTDSALTQSLSVLRRARELTLQGSSTGSQGQQAREAIAAEVEGIRETLLGLANTTYNGRPVFGGTTNGGIAFDRQTGGWVGDANEIQRRVADGTDVVINVDGYALFGDGVTSVFALLDDIAAHLKDSPEDLAGDLAQLDAISERLLSTLADVGTRYGRLETLKLSATDRLIELKSQLSNVESIDLPETVVKLQMQEVAYQAALAATARAIQPTLLDFLR
jgi:flagellar hook-associated protein 3 FlgL